jgi:hypothetical protein
MIDFYPHRLDNRLILFLEKDEKPTSLPVELQTYIAALDWDMRIITLKQICNQFSRPMLERFWCLIGFFIIIILPSVLHHFIFNAVFNPANPFDTAAEARWITFGIYIVGILIWLLPIGIFKSIGKRRISSHLAKWNTQDRASNPSAPAIPIWRVSLPGPFMIFGKLKITLPPSNSPPTTFTQNAYMPPHLANSLAGAPPGYNYYPPAAPNANPAVVAYGAPIAGYSTDVKDKSEFEREEDV